LFGITPELRHPYFLFFEKKKKSRKSWIFNPGVQGISSAAGRKEKTFQQNIFSPHQISINLRKKKKM
jgi:hypothetical protein